MKFAGAGLVNFLIRFHFLVCESFSKGIKVPAVIGFSVGRVSEGQFEYDALNGRMTPRYSLLEYYFI